MKNLMQTLREDPRLKIFSSALAEVGLADVLSGLGPLTVFAPTDWAFESLPKEREALVADKRILSTVLRYHILLVRVDAPEMENLEDTRSLRGDMVRFDANDGILRVNGIRSLQSDIECTNGILHVIDGVLMPSLGDETVLPSPESPGQS